MESTEIITKESTLNNYPCQAFYGGKWVSAIALKEAKLKTGIEKGEEGNRFDLIYLVEFTLVDAQDNSYKVTRRCWLNAEQVQLGDCATPPVEPLSADRDEQLSEWLKQIKQIAERASLVNFIEVMGWKRDKEADKGLDLMWAFQSIAKLTAEQWKELADKTQEKG